MPASLDEILAPFPPGRTWLLPALQAVQAERGWLAPDDLLAVSAHLRVPAGEVRDAAARYPGLRLAPPGAHVVRVCTGVACRVNGGTELLDGLAGRLGIAAGATTPDGQVTLEETGCALACAVAPLVEVDHRCLGRPTLDQILAACAQDHPPASTADLELSPAPPVSQGATATARLAHLVAHARAQRRPGMRLLVATGVCGLARGAAETVGALRRALGRTRLEAQVVEGACNGLCHAGPLVEILRPGAPRLTVEHVLPGRVLALVRLLQGATDHGFTGAAWADEPVAGLPPVREHKALGGQRRLLSRRWGAIAPDELGDALIAGSYAALARALDAGDPGAVTAAVKAAGLLGRGGADFPAAVKWEGCRATPRTPRYLIASGAEGEPGTFKDRHLMEADPHRLLEGMLLAAYAAGASRGILYVHGEAERSAERCARALEQAQAWGLLGPRVLGTDFTFEVELRRGAGRPFPTEAGPLGQPTVINNVETLAAVPLVVAGEAAAARTRLFCLSGHVARSGVVEVAPPATLRRLIEDLGGGLATGGRLQAVVLGGPSGVVVPPALLDTPLERPALSPGTGGVVALDDAVSVPDVVRTLLAFNLIPGEGPEAALGRWLALATPPAQA